MIPLVVVVVDEVAYRCLERQLHHCNAHRFGHDVPLAHWAALFRRQDAQPIHKVSRVPIVERASADTDLTKRLTNRQFGLLYQADDLKDPYDLIPSASFNKLAEPHASPGNWRNTLLDGL